MLALLLQAAPVAEAPPPAGTDAGGRRWSVLASPCAAQGDPNSDVVVCGRPDQIAPRLPLPAYRGPPDHPVPSNPDQSAAVALSGPGVGNECGGYGENCEPFGGKYITPLTVASETVKAVKRMTATRRYKNKGEAIPLEDTPPDLKGRVLP